MTDVPPRWTRIARGLLGVATATTTLGCFGDWVSAVTAPSRRTEPATIEQEPELSRPSGDPCVDYLADVAMRCEALLRGAYGETSCHGQLVRVMKVWSPEDQAVDHHPRAGDPARACQQYRAALPQRPRRGTRTSMGPQCRRWSELLHARCVRPLAAIPPRLPGCGANLLAFESTLGAMTFGRSENYEPQCRNEVERLEAALLADTPATWATSGDR